jgi:hypothetical protein
MAGKRKRWQRGKSTRREEPVWEPLLELAPEDIDDFMWMGEIELTDGARVQLYKHYWTRRYLHLDIGGRAFVYLDGDRYEEVDAEWLLPFLFRRRESRGDIVRRGEWIDDAEVDWVPSAVRFGIEPERSLHVIRTAGLCFEDDPDARHRWDEFLRPFVVFLGDDEDGVALEVMAVRRRDGGLLVVHAALLGVDFGDEYAEAMAWRR